ncbi:MAG: class I SAM-dependent methyltransferase [Catenulispora sp.]|nr:class I SAM-dependent methyltransferase [Catenulispora sp.]
MSGRSKHPVFARFYAKVAGPALDKAGMGPHRDRLLAGLEGEVLEIGAGNGLNFGRYPDAVKHVTAVEPEPTLREYAESAAEAAAVQVTVVDARAEALPFPDGAFDAAVACLVLCSVPDQAAALAEVHRVLRPGGLLRFFEHVQADSPKMQQVQRVLDKTVWPVFAGGCHTGRDTAAAITAARFELTDLDSFTFPKTRIAMPTGTHILGTAVRR